MTPTHEYVERILQSAEAEGRWVTLSPKEIREYAAHHYEQGKSDANVIETK